MIVYLCHECGTQLEQVERTKLYWCGRCGRRRRRPTHPALIVGRT